MYQGVEHQKFVDPGYLSNFDIVLVSYETLKKELNHVDVPHGKLFCLFVKLYYFFTHIYISFLF